MPSIESIIINNLHCDLFLPTPQTKPQLSPDTPNFIFAPTGDVTCAFTNTFLQCHFVEREMSRCGPKLKQFVWSPTHLPLDAFPLDSSQPLDWDITNAAFLRHNNKMGLLVLIIQKNASRSILCIFSDVTLGQCNRAISMHGRANLVHVISPNLESSYLPTSIGVFSEDIFAGVVAIGFERGTVAILDLCLDWQVSTNNLHASEPAVATSLVQCQSIFTANERISPLSSLMQHALIHLNDSHMSYKNYHYTNARNRIVFKIPSTAVKVTMLQIVRPILSLIVGFNFGGWQIWRLTDLKLIHTYQAMPSPWSLGPVVSAAFSEPSDDPRFCCFLWIGWQAPGATISITSNSFAEFKSSSSQIEPKTSLFQMGFKKRTEHSQPCTEDVAHEYDAFYGASERLTTTLSAPLSSQAKTEGWSPFLSCLKSIQSLSTKYITNCNLCSNRLTAFVWQASQQTVRIGLFDLDRWYHAQMPSQIRPDNSFFAVFDTSLGLPKSTSLTAYILPHTVVAFWAKKQKRELNASRLCDSGHSKTIAPPKLDQIRLQKPLPEVQLRPSVHGFQAIVPFHGNSGGACASLRFISRQEICLNTLTAAQATPGIIFKLKEWIVEAIACGLVQELDDFGEDAEWILGADGDPLSGVRLAIGVDDMPPCMLEELNDEEDEHLEKPQDPISSTRKRGGEKKETQSKRRKRNDKEWSSSSSLDLEPTWVLVANCLLEQDMIHQLKNLSGFIGRISGNEESGKKFMRDWIWLCWLGRKIIFDDLCTPIFQSASDSNPIPNLSTETLKDIGVCAHDLTELSNLAMSAYQQQNTQKSPSTLLNCQSPETANPSCSRLLIITTYAEYTRPVCLLLRLGLLPQRTAVGTDVGVENTEHYLQLSAYCPEKVQSLLESVAQRHLTTEAEISPLSNLLLRHLLGREEEERSEGEGSGSAWSIWSDQENQPVAASYPPQRLQSMCALWQVADCEQRTTRLALLVFLLFDCVAAKAMLLESTVEKGKSQPDKSRAVEHRVRYDRDTIHTPQLDPTEWAAQMHRRVMTEVVREFPYAKRFLPTIQTLWLIDRCRFSEVLQSRVCNVAYLSKLPELLPRQAELVASICLRFGQTQIAALFCHSQEETENSSSPVSGSPLLALYRVRRLYCNKQESEASESFIQTASSFRKSGRFLDFINLGLTDWESNLLFSHLRNEGERELLFACLVARAQYKEAIDLFSDDAYGRLQNQLNGGNTSVLSQIMLKTIQACLPTRHLYQFRAHMPSPLLSRDNDNEAMEIPSSLRSARVTPAFQVQLLHGDSVPSSTRLRIPETPRTARLNIGPTTVARALSSAYWKKFHEMRSLQNDISNRTSVSCSIRNPVITPSSRRFRRKIFRMMYTKSVDSPTSDKFPVVKPPKMPDFGRSDDNSCESDINDDDDDGGKQPISRSSLMNSTRLDFWTEMGKWHKKHIVPSQQPVPILKRPSSSFASQDKTASLNDMTLNTSTELSFQDCEESEHSLEADAEVTINPHTMRLGGLVCFDNELSILPEDEVGLGSIPILSSPEKLAKHFTQPWSTFSPPIKVPHSSSYKGDAVADALSAGSTQFAFSFPTFVVGSKKHAPFTPSTTVLEEEVEKEEEEEEEQKYEEMYQLEDEFEISTSPPDDESSSPSENFPENEPKSGEDDLGEMYESNIDIPVKEDLDSSIVESADNKTESTISSSLIMEKIIEKQKEKQEEEAEDADLYTPRRSRRNIKKPNRYQAD